MEINRAATRSYRAGVLCLLVVILTLNGCGRAGSKEETVTFWAMGREGETVRMLIPSFHREHPDIHIRVQTLPWTGAHQKLLTSIAGGASPDMCQLGNTWISELVAIGALTPLDREIESSRVIDRDDYFQGIWDTNIIDGALYGVPWYVDTRLLFYRRDLLSRAGYHQPPRDWSEWASQMAAIKKLVGPHRYAMLLPLNEYEPLVALGLQQTEPLLRDGDRYGNFESAGFKHALRFYADIFRNNWAPLATGTEIFNVWTDFARGYFSFYLSGPWNIAEFKARMPANLGDAWMTAPLPGPNGPGASIAGGSSLVVFKTSPHKHAAWLFLEYLSRPDVELRFCSLVADMPPRRSAWNNPTLANDPYARAFREQLERVKPAPKVPEWEHIATELRLVGERLAHGELTVDQAAVELDHRTDEILAERRWMLDHSRVP